MIQHICMKLHTIIFEHGRVSTSVYESISACACICLRERSIANLVWNCFKNKTCCCFNVFIVIFCYFQNLNISLRSQLSKKLKERTKLKFTSNLSPLFAFRQLLAMWRCRGHEKVLWRLRASRAVLRLRRRWRQILFRCRGKPFSRSFNVSPKSWPFWPRHANPKPDF